MRCGHGRALSMYRTVQLLRKGIVHDTDKWLALFGECERDRDVGKGVHKIRRSVNLAPASAIDLSTHALEPGP